MEPSSKHDTEMPRVLRMERRWAHYAQDPRLQAQVASEMFGGRALLKGLWRRVFNKLVGYRAGFQPAAVYNGLVVFHRPHLNGGGLTHGQNFSRALLELGLKRSHRVFEFGAGPGYIGYSLYANGFCEELTLADINPEAVAAAWRTAQYNHIEDRVSIYVSDCLKQIPRDEKWDLVVCNPPSLLPKGPEDIDIVSYDPEWKLHMEFYASVKEHMMPSGSIVMVEDRGHSDAATFEPMIRAGGGRVEAILYETDHQGKELEKYYLHSRW